MKAPLCLFCKIELIMYKIARHIHYCLRFKFTEQGFHQALKVSPHLCEYGPHESRDSKQTSCSNNSRKCVYKADFFKLYLLIKISLKKKNQMKKFCFKLEVLWFSSKQAGRKQVRKPKARCLHFGTEIHPWQWKAAGRIHLHANENHICAHREEILTSRLSHAFI